jgi:hypothetical protein
MIKTCGSCGKDFEAKRSAAKFCGPTCRKRASRRPGGNRADANVVDMGTARGRGRVEPAGPGPVGLATLAELERAGRVSSPAGQAALALAQRIDHGGGETGSAMASLVREYRATMADALRDVEAADDELDQIRGAAALKLLHGGRA